MTAEALLEDLRRRGVRLAVDGGRLLYSPVEGVGPDLLGALREHKAEIVAMLGPAPAPPAASEDPLTRKTDAWLWHLASTCAGGSVRDPVSGKLWHVREAVSRLLWSDWNDAWLAEAASLHRAIVADRGGPSLRDAPQPVVLSSIQKAELAGILESVNSAAESGDEAALATAWDLLNDFNARTGRAGRAPAPIRRTPPEPPASRQKSQPPTDSRREVKLFS